MSDTCGQPDAELMRRWQGGDPAAFEALVRRWQQRVAGFVSRLVDRPEQVPDLCQEVFLRVYAAGASYRESGAFSTWIYRIALNVARDSRRRRRHQAEPLMEREPPGHAPSAEQTCEEQELALAVQRALGDLPAALREVLVLRHYEDMNFEEMSRLLRTPASTLKSRFAVALGQMRVRLQQLGWSREETT